MRQLSDVEIERIKTLTKNSVELTLIEPTQNGLLKSILDATGPVRVYLKQKGLHDYEKQKQGQENKVFIKAHLINYTKVVPSLASLYRPPTKKGDPRIWFKGLPGFSAPNDIIGIIEFHKELYLLNITRTEIDQLLKTNISNPLQEIINEINATSNLVAEELLTLLKGISKRGAVPALLNADTAIGRTLETLLGININSSKQPDYKGIELKSFREKRGNRKSLFAQVPDWSLSKFKSSAEILHNFGYERGEDFKLYCTVSAIIRNSQGFKLNLNAELNQLIENSDKAGIGDFVVWALDTLHTRLLEKHNETFWIATTSTQVNGIEHFHYTKVEHTRKPIISQFDILLQQGIITLDHLIKKVPSGKIVEKGPIFKIRPNSLGLLFPPSKKYNLI